MQTKKNIDIFINIIDNFGDMGFVAEFLHYYQKNFPDSYFFTIYTNNKKNISQFFAINNIRENIRVLELENWKKSAPNAISFFHAPIKKDTYDLALRVDYFCIDDNWLQNNHHHHIHSTTKNPIIELIPSPKNSGS